MIRMMPLSWTRRSFDEPKSKLLSHRGEKRSVRAASYLIDLVSPRPLPPLRLESFAFHLGKDKRLEPQRAQRAPRTSLKIIEMKGET
jgi:hypothetical protein